VTRLLSVDVGGAHIAGALVEGGRVLRREQIAVERSDSFLTYLPDIEGMLAMLDDRHEARGIAVAFPALIEPNRNRVLSTPAGKFGDVVGFDFDGWARDRLNLRVRLELDGRMALLGERFVGALRGENDAALLSLGTGIGTAAMMGGELVTGRNGQAAALGGHLSVSAAGPACICGSVGCIEAIASTWALPRLISALSAESGLASTPRPGFKLVFDLAREGDEGARQIRDHCLEMWATAALNLVHAYDSAVILLTGGIVAAPEVLPFVRGHVCRYAWAARDRPHVRQGILGPDAALLGAEPLWEMNREQV
jgi:glucokinase